MKVLNLSSGMNNGRARVSATVAWEDCDRPEREIYFETDARFGEDLSCNPDAFLLATAIPAMRHGERRVLIEGKVCPQIRNGLNTAMQLLATWYGKDGHNLVEIEPTKGFGPPMPRPMPRIASFMSGGVDAQATLRRNRLDFPLDHPGSIKDCFLVHGIDLGGYEKFDKKERNFELAVSSLSVLATEAKVTLIPVFINLRFLDDSDVFFAHEFHGAVLAAIAHTFSNRITTALIASSDYIRVLRPWGSHPLLDQYYSSSSVLIRHDSIEITRFEKLTMLTQWDAALQTLRSCYHPFRPDDVLNCGKCEKCLRTMTGLLVLGKLRECSTFQFNDVSSEMLNSLKPSISSYSPAFAADQFLPLYLDGGNADQWRQLVGPLKEIGRRDLATVLEAKLAEFDKDQKRLARSNWKGAVKQIDQKYFGGYVRKINQLIKQRSAIS